MGHMVKEASNENYLIQIDVLPVLVFYFLLEKKRFQNEWGSWLHTARLEFTSPKFIYVTSHGFILHPFS